MNVVFGNVKEMTDAQLVVACVWLDKERRKTMELLNSYKAELQARGSAEMDDHNTKFVKYYCSEGTACVADSLTLDILNPAKLKGCVGEGVWDAKVKMIQETKYKCDPKFERMLKAVFTKDYTFEMTLEEFLDEMSIKPDNRQKRLLLKKLKGDFEKDKETLNAVLVPEGGNRQDFEVELYYIYKIKNAELIKAFLPEEMLDGTLAAIRESILVEGRTSITIDYDNDKE